MISHSAHSERPPRYSQAILCMHKIHQSYTSAEDGTPVSAIAHHMQACRGCLVKDRGTESGDVVMAPCALSHACQANLARDPTVPSDLAAPG